MTIRELLFQKWELSGLKINAGFLGMEWSPNDSERMAAWELYVELLTRVATQPLPEDQGSEIAALESLAAFFPITREIIKQHGPQCVNFARIAIIILNQKIRPVTAKWHIVSKKGLLEQPGNAEAFRQDLAVLREDLLKYSGLLAEIAGVENILPEA